MSIDALFPRYLFVPFSAGVDSIGPIRSTTGVSGLVRFTEEPAVVTDLIIDSLRRSADDRNGVHYPKAAGFTPGDTVIIDAGPLSGVEAVLVADTGQERVAILLHMLGRENRVSAQRDLRYL